MPDLTLGSSLSRSTRGPLRKLEQIKNPRVEREGDELWMEETLFHVR